MKASNILLALSLALAACGKSDDTPVSASNTLAGSTWTGFYTPTNSPTSKSVNMQLNTDKSFSINMTDQISASMKGNFTEMPRNKALIFNVSESGSDLLGLTGETYDYSYDLSDNEMSLNGASGKYLLKRDGTEEGEKKEKAPLEGDWRCVKTDNIFYFLNISADSFRGRKEESNTRVVYFEGTVDGSTVTSGKKKEILLHVKTSNASGIKGNKLLLREKDELNALLIQLNANSQEVPDTSIECKVQS